jgi:hypothetical protein
VENYMDYNVDSCANMFTRGQRERVHLCLDVYRSTLWSHANLVSTGCAPATGIGDPPLAHAITIAPNPASEFVDILVAPGQGAAQVQLFTLSGERLLSQQIVAGRGRIRTDAMADGVYFLQLTAAGRTWTEKLIIAGR